MTEMPPTPPAGALDIRYATNNLVSMLPKTLGSVVDIPVSISSAEFPLHVSLRSSTDLGYSISVIENGVEHSLADGSTVTIHSANSRVVLRVSKLVQSPSSFSLEQNYPNPFNPLTVIRYSLPKSGTRYAVSVQLKIYNMIGEEVATIVDGMKEFGNYSVSWDASSYPSGIYFYKLDVAGLGSDVRKMILLK